MADFHSPGRGNDIDLLFCSELHAGWEVAKLLAAKLGDSAAVVDGAWVSHAESDGESDWWSICRASEGPRLR